MAIVVPAVVRLRSDINTVAPGRDKGADGTYGDAAHKLSKSSHNADDTPGSKAEYEDADNIAEVRGLDIDSDLNADFTAQDVVNAILASPSDRKRTNYIIFNRKIYSKSRNFAPVAYSGSDPHTGHIHFSIDPVYDNDDSPWTSVLRLSGGRSELFCKQGDNSEAVGALQVRLKNLGYYKGAADNDYGPGTTSALKAACLAASPTTNANGASYDKYTMYYVDMLLIRKYAVPGPPGKDGKQGVKGDPGELKLPANLTFKGTLQQSS